MLLKRMSQLHVIDTQYLTFSNLFFNLNPFECMEGAYYCFFAHCYPRFHSLSTSKHSKSWNVCRRLLFTKIILHRLHSMLVLRYVVSSPSSSSTFVCTLLTGCYFSHPSADCFRCTNVLPLSV